MPKYPYKILEYDPYLLPYRGKIEKRMERYRKTRSIFLDENATLSDFASGYLYYGIARCEGGWVYREFAPNADELHLVGDFNGWNPTATPMRRVGGGNWEVYLSGENALYNGQHVKVLVTKNGQSFMRVPRYIRQVAQDEHTREFCGIVCAPDAPYPWTDGNTYKKRKPKSLYIYEAHIGMAQEYGGIGTYREFADARLPYIADLGYNAVQLMAVMQHPYYASFGYQVTNFYAPSAWFGSPDDLKYLVNKAHELGLTVLLDVVHSHSAVNDADGMAYFDGTLDEYFQSELHPAWKTRLFRYDTFPVLHFLLSNLKFWQEEYHFDGFRFDGVTSMLYHSHGLGMSFCDYSQYFGEDTDEAAMTYLMLANELVHTVNPYAVTIAEDMSGMPGMCLPIADGGFGFDARLSMGVPDYWIRLVKDTPDEAWDMGKLWYELTQRRPMEKNIGYCESHDQALVGDKTLIFRMADAKMYTDMDKSVHSEEIDRAVALHKMIRLITLSLAGEGYLNFMGNEFGHPEWIDFPREGNGWSGHYARRQWSLAYNPNLKYEWLLQFDKAILRMAKDADLLSDSHARNLWVGHREKVLAYEKRDLLFLFNFHPTDSMENFFVPLPNADGHTKYRVILSTDEVWYGGFGRTDMNYVYDVRNNGFSVYLPCRTALVFKKVSENIG